LERNLVNRTRTRCRSLRGRRCIKSEKGKIIWKKRGGTQPVLRQTWREKKAKSRNDFGLPSQRSIFQAAVDGKTSDGSGETNKEEKRGSRGQSRIKRGCWRGNIVQPSRPTGERPEERGGRESKAKKVITIKKRGTHCIGDTPGNFLCAKNHLRSHQPAVENAG